ncbi:hypothetical protein B4U79_07377, partial [Dinothrombium tinctorium]
TTLMKRDSSRLVMLIFTMKMI